MKNRIRLSFAVASACAVSSASAPAFGSGFALMEQNASGLGNAFAGAAATAEDAGTVLYNPAGLTLLPQGHQFAIGADGIRPSAKFEDRGSVASGGALAGINPAAARPLGNTGGDAGDWIAVPFGYYATQLAPNWRFGVGVSAPFGLRTEYDPAWMGRFQAIKSDLRTINVNPSLAFRVNDSVSVGAGLNYQSVKAELTKNVNYVAAVFGAAGAGAASLVPAANAEGRVTVKGDDYAWGWNAGVMFNPTPATRIGLAYRSSISYRIAGTVSFDNAPPGALGAAFATDNVHVDIEMPDSFSAAVAQQFGSRWTLLADATWTGWSKIKELKIVRDSGATLDTTPENFRNTWRVGVGTNYKFNDGWTLKAGVAYDQTPVNDADRTPRLPDSDRLWLALGAQFQVLKAAKVDIGYAHLFMKNASIDQTAGNATAFGRLTGTYKNSVDVLGLQYTQTF